MKRRKPHWKVQLQGGQHRDITQDVFTLDQEPPETLFVETHDEDVVRFQRHNVKDGVTPVQAARLAQGAGVEPHLHQHESAHEDLGATGR